MIYEHRNLFQEIEPRVAEELCRLFPMDEGIDMTPILFKSKISSRNMRLRSGHHRRDHHGRPLQRSHGGPPRGHAHNTGRYTGLCSSCLGLSQVRALPLFPLGLLSAVKMCSSFYINIA